MNLYDAVYKRTSTRTFLKEELSRTDVVEIQSILKKYNSKAGPFDHVFEFTFNLNNSKDTDGKKIGTYGMLKNVPSYIGGVCENNFDSIVDFGYVFEHIILELTMKNFGTCWLGGTFKRKDYRRKLRDDEIIPAISPVGYSSNNRSFVDRLVRKSAQSNNRINFNELFFDENLEPLNLKSSGPILDCLSMVRRAPSASNKQPWRIILDSENTAHFYISRTENYAKLLNYDIQALDIGIALAHYEIGLVHNNLKYSRKRLEKHPSFEGCEYIISINQSK